MSEMESAEVIVERSYLRSGVWLLIMLAVIAVIAIVLVAFLNTPPSTFTHNARVTIEPGSSLGDIAKTLKANGLVRVPLLFELAVSMQGEAENMHAGIYQFASPLSTVALADAMIQKTAAVPPIRVTIPEGSTLADFDEILSSAIPRIEKGAIVAAASNTEGILFPDTYLIPEDYDATDVVTLLSDTFKEKLKPFAADIIESGFTEQEIVTLASLVEREANDSTSMRMVSGILFNRLEINMPLQVDAAFMYLLQKSSAELTPEDLAYDSPYNTYLYAGLPPGPIASPSIAAIEAVLKPIASENLYYLTGNDGMFYYAKTFEQHKLNKERYLR